MIRVDLPYPHGDLSPNGRAHHHAKARAVKSHRLWADVATLEALQAGEKADLAARPIPVRLTVRAKPRGPLPDRDNCVAMAKSYLDGIAQRLGVNDIAFASPVVEFATPRDGRFVIEVGA